MTGGRLAVDPATGIVVMAQMMGQAHLGDPPEARARRSANCPGNTSSSVVLGGRTVKMERPRGRTTGGEEIELVTRSVFFAEGPFTRLVTERMVAGVATRRQESPETTEVGVGFVRRRREAAWGLAERWRRRLPIRSGERRWRR